VAGALAMPVAAQQGNNAHQAVRDLFMPSRPQKSANFTVGRRVFVGDDPAPGSVLAAAHKTNYTYPWPFVSGMRQRCAAPIASPPAEDSYDGEALRAAHEIFNLPANDVRYRGKASFTGPNSPNEYTFEEGTCREFDVASA